MELLKKYFSEFKETLSENIRKKYKFIGKTDALLKLHFPKSKIDIEQAKHRLSYEELYNIHYKALAKKHENFKHSQGKSLSMKLNPDTIKELLGQLPFTLTDQQKIVLFQVLKDMESQHAMQRLLE